MIRGISDDYGGKDDDDKNDVNGKDSGDEDDDDDDDGEGDDTCDNRELKQLRRRRRQPQKTIGLIIKTTALHVHHAFLVNFFDVHWTTTT